MAGFYRPRHPERTVLYRVLFHHFDAAGVFNEIPRIDDSRLAEIFAREVLSFLVGREILSPECMIFSQGDGRSG